ncbi:MAG TPA: biotin/lipoyl-containing protein, partial [Allosphingosinicella sp.]|nr:biotin/lipoyl-containing protein [Allosphingosinicella sp.]
MATDIIVPTLGESITEATLGEWLKKPGDAVKADEPVASLETDKVAVEVPSPVDGVMGDHLVAPGDTVAVGAAIGRVESGSGMPAKAEPEHAAPDSTPVNPQGAGENVELRAD